MKNIFVIAILIVIVQSACSFLIPTPTAAPAAQQIAPTEAPAVTEAPAPTEAPAATEAPVATDAPAATEAPAATDAPADAPAISDFQQWNGTLSINGKIQTTALFVEEVRGSSFKGKMAASVTHNSAPAGSSWNDGTRYQGTITTVEGEIVTDFSQEEDRWNYLADYQNGDKTGTWLKWTEKSVLKGTNVVIGSWYYGHIRENKLTAIVFANNTDTKPLADAKLELDLEEVEIIDLPPVGSKTVTIDPATLNAPHQWSGTYSRKGNIQSTSLIVEEVNGDAFEGKMTARVTQNSAPPGSSWNDGTRNLTVITKMEGSFVTDFGDAFEQARWNFHEDYEGGDRSGIWFKWTETAMVKGTNYPLNGWYYGHIRSDGTLVAIYFFNDTDPTPDASFYCILNLVP